MHRRLSAIVSTAALVSLAVAPGATASAPTEEEAFVNAVLSVAPEVFHGTPESPDDRSLELEPTPHDEALGVTVSDVEVALPVAEDVDVSELPTGDPLVTTDDGVAIAPVEKEDGSVQVTLVIADADAPVRYEFPVEPVTGAELTVQPDGSALYLAEDGSLLLGATAPWARDAEGRELRTHFEVDGTTLVQVVEHTEAGVAYPVVADPWLGKDLFSKVWTDTYNGQLRVNARKSTWGQMIHAPGTGQLVFLNAGWNEVKAKAPRVTEKATLRQQYECHVGGGFFNLAGDWNLEKFRPTRTTTWTYGVAVHRCNWTTATRY